MPSINESKCVLVTGATSGIGRALSLNIASLPSSPKVIAAGRRQDRLDGLVRDNIDIVRLDVDADQATLKKYIEHILAKYPELDTVIFSAGIQREFCFDGQKDVDLDKVYSEFNINYLSVVAMITYLLPHFHKLSLTRPCLIVIVTSGLALLPASSVPNYSASKSALHSFTISLQAQLKSSNIKVIEIIPPLVESELHDAEGTTEKLSKVWMPLDQFVEETMEGLQKGDAYVSSGTAKSLLEKFEMPKIDMVMNNSLPV